MSEIEKLMKNAKVEKAPNFNNCYPEIMKCRHCEHYKVIDECTGSCLNEVYPEFTAEKQLEIIKLLTQQCDLAISHFEKWEFIHFDGQESTQITGKDFTETFAKLINAYWENLTEEEKAKIKEILNG